MNTLIDLKAELERAYEQYDLAKYIDNTARMAREQEYWSNRISELKARIAEFDDD